MASRYGGIIERSKAAPSIFDKRPLWKPCWRARRENSVELYADADRPGSRHSPREVAISCGAAPVQPAACAPGGLRQPSWSGCCPASTRDRRRSITLGTARVPSTRSVEVSSTHRAAIRRGSRQPRSSFAMWLGTSTPGVRATARAASGRWGGNGGRRRGGARPGCRRLHPRETEGDPARDGPGGKLASREMQLMTLSHR